MADNGYFETLADTDMWVEALAALGGFLAPQVVQYLVENKMGMDLPNLTYGVLAIVLAEVGAPDEYKRNVQIGAGAKVGYDVADSAGLIARIPGGGN